MESNRELEYHSLCFENHGAILIESLSEFFIKKAYVNVTLVCKGEEIVAHQTVLASCSPVFDKLLRGKSERHPIIIFNDVSKEEMMTLLEFMYKGIVNVPKTTLPSLLKIAKTFRIRGLEYEKSRKNGTQATPPELRELSTENSGSKQQSLGTSALNKAKIEPESPVNETTISPRKKSRREPSSKVIKINPCAANRRILEDSDSTFCEEDMARPGPSKIAKLPSPTRNSDSDIEIIDSNPVVVINETQPDVDSSPEWFRKTQPRNKRKVIGSDSDILGNMSKKANKPVIRDSDESLGENEVRVNSLASTNKNNNRKPNSSNLSAATTADGTSIANKLLKKKKYKGSYSEEENSELLKLPFHKLRNYCVLCCKFKKDHQTHFKRTHNVAPRGKISCKVCSRSFFRKEFLKFHKCKPL